MGASNSCTCDDDKKYRFKGFIVSVYPDDKHGGPDEEALGKLNSYVGSNPERIPRVCRKITKILRRHLSEHKEDRVMVSLVMLRSLIEHSKVVDGFVPHTIDMCALLLSTNVARYHVGAADVLCVLCYRLSTMPNTDSARRLIADNKDRLVPQLLKMTSDNIASRKDVKSMQTRFAGIQALGNIAHCIHSTLAGSVGGIMQAMIVNLILVLRERAQKPLSDASVRMLAQRHYGGAGAPAVEPPLLELPSKAEEQDVVYALACSHGIGAIAACTTTAGVEDLLSRVTGLLDKQNGWAVPYVPSLVFSDIVSAMQRRPQQLGFSVYQCLCEVGQRNSDPAVRVGVLRSLQACLDALPMTGGRPAVVLDYLLDVMKLPITSTTAVANAGGAGGAEADAETAKIIKDTHDAVVRLTLRLLQSTYRQRNAPQLQNILVSLWSLLRSAQATASPSPTLTLRLLIVAAPYIRAVPLVDRKDIEATQALDVYLNGSDDKLRHLAARVLTGLLAGLPEEHTATPDSDSSSSKRGQGATATLSQLPSRSSTLCTDEKDVAYAQEWVKRMAASTDSVTPRCVVAVADVLCALMAGYGVSGMPFNLMFLWTLQQRCVRAETGGTLANSPTKRADSVMLDDVASQSTSVATTTMLASRTPTSQLTRAWLHMVAAVLVTTGNVYGVPNLVTYGMDVLSRRAALGQLASCFEPAVSAPERGNDVYTVSGLRYLASDKARVLSSEFTEAPVSKLPSFSYVANIIVDADLPGVSAVFGANEVEELHTIIEDVCFQPESEVNVSLASAIAARDTSISAASAVPKPSRFSLAADDAAKVAALRSLRITVVDNSVPRTQDSRGVLTLGEAATAATATVATKVQAIAQHYSVNASTQLLPPDVAAALPPLPMLPAVSEEDDDDDDDESAGASQASGALHASNGNGRDQLGLRNGYYGRWGGGSEATGEGTPGINPIDIDVAIRASCKSQALLSAKALPAGRYVSLL